MKSNIYYANKKTSRFYDTLNRISHYNQLLKAQPALTIKPPTPCLSRLRQNDFEVMQENKRLVKKLHQIMQRKSEFKQNKSKQLSAHSEFRDEEKALTIYRKNTKLLSKIKNVKSTINNSSSTSRPRLSTDQFRLERQIQSSFYELRYGEGEGGTRKSMLKKVLERASKRSAGRRKSKSKRANTDGDILQEDL